MLRFGLAAFILSTVVLFAAPTTVAAASNEPGWLGVVVARGELKEQIESTPIVDRPNRPFHFYGNTVRRDIIAATRSPGRATWSKAARRDFQTPVNRMSSTAFPDQGLPQAAAAWALDPAVTMLNHGSFGACPQVVLQRQRELRRQMEARPVQFLVRQMPELLDASRRRLAQTVGADPQDLVFVPNATAGVNSVLRSLRFRQRRRDPRHRARLQRLQQCGAVRRPAKPRNAGRCRDPLSRRIAATDRRRGNVARGPADADCPVGSYQQPVGRCLSHREVGRAAAPAGNRDLDRRGPRPRHGAARLAADRPDVLHRQLPQVALHAAGDRVPLCSPRSPGGNPAAGHQPRLQPAAARL